MSDATTTAATAAPTTGTCLCGAITLTIPAAAVPLKSMSCYCTHCAKNAGGPYQTNAMFATTDISVSDPQGQLRTYSILDTFSGKPKEKAFCGTCGCTFYTRPGHHEGKMTVVKTGILDAGAIASFQPKVELYARDRPQFCQALEGTKQFDTMPMTH